MSPIMPNMTEQEILPKLKQVFGYDSFREGQFEVINHILNGRHVLSVMPTGAGKSLCFQLPAVISEARTIVVSPIIALMDDQVAALRAVGVSCATIHSGKMRDDNVTAWRNFVGGNAKILYISPERLMQERMINALQQQNIGMFVVDEAHCISKWGASFRPDYEALSQLSQFFPDAIIAAFTATADRSTRLDINQKLSGGNGEILLRGFDRPNLSLSVKPKQDIKQAVLDFVQPRMGQCGIIYCLSRNETDTISAFLKDQGINAIPYHAGKPADVRSDAYNRFMTEADAIMVATIAFGMGIDKPDIRFVVHASLPGSMEAFYQEIGRAGRDNLASETALFFSLSDVVKRQRMVFEGEGSEEFKLLEYKRLDALVGYCESVKCRKVALLSYFDEDAEVCGKCDNCITPPTLENYTEQSQFLISTIDQTGQFFGVNHIIDVVRGAQNAKIKEKNHDILPCFGLGQTYSKSYFQSLLRQLISSGVLRVNLDRYGAIQLTPRATAIAEGKDEFFGRIEISKSSASKSARSNKNVSLDGDDLKLYQQLKDKRLELAKAKEVPAFVVFADATLQQIAKIKPLNEAEFLTISGIGERKLAEYFDPFSKVIHDFMADH